MPCSWPCPIAIFSAICTSQFMHHDLRAKVKPIIEVMAACRPWCSVLAGLWLALLERMLPALAGMALVLPMLVIVASFAWYLCPLSITRHFPGQRSPDVDAHSGSRDRRLPLGAFIVRGLVVRRQHQNLAFESARYPI